ncbi:MAG: 3-phosphoshikimate 1-carboxyvinyltransferase [Saprospiraceae bacterium]|nr:3-phosphoshikimate 1-carboxyvinyltransferase [Saprospiraceae bacterium]
MIYTVAYSSETPIKGQIQLDGSKSISNRLLMLSASAATPFQIENLGTSDDVALMQKFVHAFPDFESFHVHNAGTVTRFVTAFLANEPGTWELQCDPPMKKRPIKLLVDALREIGATIHYLEEDDYLPLKIEGQVLTGNYVSIPADISSQYISALMMIGPSMPNGITIHLEGEIASKPYIDITVKAMEQCGAKVTFEGQEIQVQPAELTAESVFNESDWSAAAFYYALVALQPNSSMALSKLLPPAASTQGDAAVVDVFKPLGVQSKFNGKTVELSQSIPAQSSVQFDFFDKPDMVPAVAVTCAALGIPATFTGVKNLVIKESNRLVAVQTELAKVDVHFFEVTKDEWKLEGQINASAITEVTFDTYEDHRIAMAFATLAAKYPQVNIHEPHVVSKSYPAYWDDLASIGFDIREM